MKRGLWFVANVVVISILSVTCVHASASAADDSPAAVAALQVKADQAQPRDRCFLYARLVNRMTDLAGHQLNSGDSGQAAETLKLVQQYAEKIHVGVAEDSKRLRDAELLMQRTSFRLQDILGGASYEDRQTLEATLKQLNQVQSQLMTQVFKKQAAVESSDLMEDFTHKEMIRAAAVLWPVGNRTNLRVPHPLRSLQRVGYATVSIEIRDFPSEVKA